MPALQRKTPNTCSKPYFPAPAPTAYESHAGGAGHTLARTHGEDLGETVVISLPVASYRKLPGLRAWGPRVGDLWKRAHMREGRHSRAQGGPGKPGLTLTLPHRLNTSLPGTDTDFRHRPSPTGGLPWKCKT